MATLEFNVVTGLLADAVKGVIDSRATFKVWV
jgi:hypothetical protein